MEVAKQKKHFVLVHGACHGAWIWYKIKPRLESAGHQVTALDMSASGINPKKLDELRTLYDYTLPLIEFMASVPPNEKVILVGHSLGGLNLAVAMDKYPEKISVAVFLAAFMPDSTHTPSYVLDQDLTLAKTLVRPGSLFLEDLSKTTKFSTERYGSVKRVYVICNEDKGIPEEFQQWMIDNIGAMEAKEIKGADHMAMCSKPAELCHCLLEIANKYD
ncbi:unnamed protein product [Ilex paraguariensis]|uniref:AB hydrolase-1 domain-containing protein n=1 Tax=Ilex paraguariensis TaxID=185542 RepID=A0ABC8TAH7_9AQUA